MTAQPATGYPARLAVEYPQQHDRMTTFFRAFLVIASTSRSTTPTSNTIRTGGCRW